MLVSTDIRISETGAGLHCRRGERTGEPSKPAEMRSHRAQRQHMFVSCLGKLSRYLVEPGFSAAASFAFCMIVVLPFGSRRGTPTVPVYRLPATAPTSCRSMQT